MKAIIDEVNYCLEWCDMEEIVDLVLDNTEIIKSDDTTLVIEQSDFEDYEIGDEIYISFCDTDDEKVFKVKVVDDSNDEWTFKFLTSYLVEEYFKIYSDSLPQHFTMDIPKDWEDDVDYYIPEEISNTVGWLVYSVSYELVED